MAKTMELVTNFMMMEIEDNMRSKVDGRRNWVIKVRNHMNVETGEMERVISYRGSYGQADKYGVLVERLGNISKYQIRWFKFTYKKDYLEAVEKLMAAGVKDTGEWRGF